MATSTHTRRDRYWLSTLPAISQQTTSALSRSAAVLALLAMVPGIVNFTAFDLLRPTIAQSLGVSPADVSWAVLFGNAGVPLGLLVGVEMMRRVPFRRLTFTALGLLALGALCGALAPNLAMLIFAHTTQGFASGMAASAVAMWLLARAVPNRVPTTVVVLGIGLFGAAALGPMVGGVVEHEGTWRGLLIIEALLAAAALVPARVIASTRSADRQAGFALPTLVLAAVGVTLLFIGIGELSWHHWTRPEIQVPAFIGAAALVAVIVGEWVSRGPLASVRHTGVALLGCLGAFGFGGLVAAVLQFLQDVRALGAQDAGWLFWPAPITALLALILVGRVFTRPRWVVALATFGVLLLALAGWQLIFATEYTSDGSVLQMTALLGAGMGLSVAPAILVAVLSVPRTLTARALALMAFLPYVLFAASGPVLTYAATVRQTVHYGNLLWEKGWTVAVGVAANLSAATTDGTSKNVEGLLTRSLMLGINDAAVVLVLLIVLGAAASAVLVRAGTPASARRPR
jgi:hypothetical protein